MKDRTRMAILLAVLLVSTAIAGMITIFMMMRLNDLLDYEVYDPAVFTESCLLMPLVGFALVVYGAVMVPLTNRCRVILSRNNGKTYDMDSSYFVTDVMLFGLTMPLVILYSEYADPYMLGESSASIALVTLFPFLVQSIMYMMLVGVQKIYRRCNE